MTKVAIVILNWNGLKHLRTYLPSVTHYSQGERIRVIVADNGSTDESLEFIASNYPEIEIIRLDHNYGFAEGYNQALNNIDAEYFVLLNSDVEVTEGWLTPMIELLDNDQTIAACQPKILSWARKNQFEHAGAAGGFIDKYGYPLCRGRVLDEMETDHGQYDNKAEVFWATGACMMIRASLYKEFGGFDKDFWAHMEEIDLCWRLKNRGYKIYFTPNSIVYHLGGGSLPYNSPHKVYLNFRNNLFMLFKNLPSRHFYRCIVFRMILDGLAGINFLLEMKWRFLKEVLHAHLDFYRALPVLKEKRSALEQKRTQQDHPQILQHSMVRYFFLHKKRKFSDIVTLS
ncbi:MAG: glycosyltransferase family 2 protein [Bacteroidota bacterium]|nr:glycosyltransferase family 2 protein [Bacteroidota bacterium]MDP4206743.1 glycosyltransferase family 2 protein [Bacteroidota bacterium]